MWSFFCGWMIGEILGDLIVITFRVFVLLARSFFLILDLIRKVIRKSIMSVQNRSFLLFEEFGDTTGDPLATIDNYKRIGILN